MSELTSGMCAGNFSELMIAFAPSCCFYPFIALLVVALYTRAGMTQVEGARFAAAVAKLTSDEERPTKAAFE